MAATVNELQTQLFLLKHRVNSLSEVVMWLMARYAAEHPEHKPPVVLE